ncbi:hypothetical protein DASC09_026410 [Saccharomycopsis crataegensis]|uniref:Ubiquitin-like domain-containing protein n=1 Tax=Saccharomycopsis crataegensis TaxID=43959 RepID=A0AAV5QKX9_9ASCO|nr:hypothetical protein DASC09_026410 [Saccharomycopsis crataegensis]
MSFPETITIHLIFNSPRQELLQDLTINSTFLAVNNLPYSHPLDMTVADVLHFLIANWQPKWGPKPMNIAQVRFIQSARSLRSGLKLADLNLDKNSTFHVAMRPISTKDPKANRRASLLVPTSHNQRSASNSNSPGTRTFSGGSHPLAVNTTDELNFHLNPDGTTTVTGAEQDLSNYYNGRYGPSSTMTAGTRASYAGIGLANRNSYYQRYSYVDPSSSSQTYSLNRNYHRYSDTSNDDSEVEEDMMNHPEFGIQNQQQHFHHVITTERGKARLAQQQKQEQEKRNSQMIQSPRENQSRRSSHAAQRNVNQKPPQSEGGCCIIM